MYNESKELEEFNKEKIVLEAKNSSYQNDIANKLINENLGIEIHQTLSNPIKITKFQIFMFKIKKIISLIINTL